MLKYVFLLINSISILFYNLFFGDGVSITPKLPTSAKPNTEFVAEFVIKKGGTSGFAKLQIDLPAGLSAKDIESKGGSFSYSNGVVKYIWTSLPSDDEFTVKVNIMADGTVSGAKQIQGKFSYITNNAKQQAEFGPIEVMFDAGAASVVTTNTVQPVTTNTVEPVATNTVAPVATNTVAVSNTSNSMPETFSPPKDPNAAVSVHRRITSVGNNEFIVDLVIFKENLKGFAKYTDKIPAGFRASAISTNGASFSFNDQIAKLVWVSLPPSEELKISYKLSMENKPATKVNIVGEFSYLENDQTQKVKSKEDEIVIPSENNTVVATNTVVPETNTVTATPTVTPTATTTPIETNTVTTNTVAVVETPTTTPTTTVTGTIKEPETNTTPQNTYSSKSNTAVNFQVQVGAFKSNISTERIASMYNISDNIRTDMHEGLTKFLVGNYNDYKGARDKRESIKSKGVSGAFVTAYNSGKRITIQEALMITSQKWLR